MKHNIITFIFVLSLFSGSLAHANGFGDSFYNQTPAGLADFTAEDSVEQDIAMDDIAEQLSNIMTAAGDESDAEASSSEKAAE